MIKFNIDNGIKAIKIFIHVINDPIWLRAKYTYILVGGNMRVLGPQILASPKIMS